MQISLFKNLLSLLECYCKFEEFVDTISCIEGRNFSTTEKNNIVYQTYTRIKRDFLKHKTIKVRDNKLNRRFGVDITPLSR